MSSCLVSVRGYWGAFATTFLIRLAYLTLVLTLCATASTVMAHEKEGFVVLPNQAPRFSGPAWGRGGHHRDSRHTRANGRLVWGVAVHERPGGWPTPAHPPHGG